MATDFVGVHNSGFASALKELPQRLAQPQAAQRLRERLLKTLQKVGAMGRRFWAVHGKGVGV